MNYTKWICDEIKYISTTFKDRDAGSESVKKSESHMAEILSKCSDKVETERFIMSPKAFMGSIPLDGILTVVAIMCYLLSMAWIGFYWISLAVLLVVLISIFLEYFLYLPVLDFAFKKKIGQNLYAEKKASGESKKKVIVCGHADAAYEIKMFQWGPLGFYPFTILAFGSTIATIVLNIIALCNPEAPQSVIPRLVLLVIALIGYWPFFKFANWNLIVPGANDNLTGCMLGISILKEMEEKGERFEHTDVGVLITDGEESGLRGAMAYAKEHAKELNESNTIIIAADTITEKEHLMVYRKGINGTQKNDKHTADLLYEAGKKCGVEMPDSPWYLGGCDAEAFSRAGVKAAAICANNHIVQEYYHYRKDTWEALRPETIELTRDIIKEAIKLYDEEAEDSVVAETKAETPETVAAEVSAETATEAATATGAAAAVEGVAAAPATEVEAEAPAEAAAEAAAAIKGVAEAQTEAPAETITEALAEAAPETEAETVVTEEQTEASENAVATEPAETPEVPAEPEPAAPAEPEPVAPAEQEDDTEFEILDYEVSKPKKKENVLDIDLVQYEVPKPKPKKKENTLDIELVSYDVKNKKK